MNASYKKAPKSAPRKEAIIGHHSQYCLDVWLSITCHRTRLVHSLSEVEYTSSIADHSGHYARAQITGWVESKSGLVSESSANAHEREEEGDWYDCRIHWDGFRGIR